MVSDLNNPFAGMGDSEFTKFEKFFGVLFLSAFIGIGLLVLGIVVDITTLLIVCLVFAVILFMFVWRAKGGPFTSFIKFCGLLFILGVVWLILWIIYGLIS